MRPLASFADDLARLGSVIAGGAAFGLLFALWFGFLLQFYLGRELPLERWALLGTGLGSVVGFVALAFDQ